MRYELRALGVGGILDQSIRIFRDRFGLFMAIALCLQFPASAIFGLLLGPARARSRVAPNASPEEAMAALQQVAQLFLLLIPLLILWGIVIGPLFNAAIVNSTARVYLGAPASFRESMRVAFNRYFPFLSTWFLFSLIVGLGTLFCILPGIIFFFRYALAINVSVIERISGSAALNRSRDLMRAAGSQNYTTLFLLLLVLSLINASLNAVVSLIPESHVAAIVGALIQSVEVAFSLIANVVFYFSTRCRAENFDLLQLAQAVGEGSAREPEVANEA